MKKIEISTIIEVAIGIVIGGIIVGILHSMFGGWFAAHGADIHGLTPAGTPPKA